MAEPTAPSLPVARETQPYSPVSWAAVGALATGVLFIILLAFYGIQSFNKKQPLIYDMFVGLPILTLVLALVARMHIRNSEGTRTGMKLAVIAFWIGLVGGLGYGSYLMAISLAVRNDAEKQFVEWAKGLNDLDPSNPLDPNLYRAFIKTMPPGLRKGVSPSDFGSIDRRFGNQLAGFRQNDLITICYRNRGECKFTPQGLVNWITTPKTMQEPAKVDATLACTLECPEGIYDLNVTMQATTDEAGRREWQLVPNAQGLLKSAKLTDYGRRLYELKLDASQAAARFLNFVQDTSKQDRGYLLFIESPYSVAAEQNYAQHVEKISSDAVLAVAGTTAYVERSAFGYEADLFGRVFVPLLGADAPKSPEDRKAKEAEMRKTFAAIWNKGHIRVAGSLVKDNTDKDSVLVIGDKQIELRFPVELALPGGEAATNTARGKIILVCGNPDILPEIKKLRESANPAEATDIATPKPDWKPLKLSWKIVRIESDLIPIPVVNPKAERMPGG